MIGSILESGLLLGGVFVLVAASVACVMFGVRSLLLARPNLVERRLRTSLAPAPGEVALAPSVLEPPRSSGFLEATLRPLASVAKPTDEEELEGLQSRLSHAGYRSERALYVYLVAKLLGCMSAAGAVLWFNSTQAQPLEQAALYTVVAMIIAYYFPNIWLSGRVKERQTAIERSMPDALDLL